MTNINWSFKYIQMILKTADWIWPLCYCSTAINDAGCRWRQPVAGNQASHLWALHCVLQKLLSPAQTCPHSYRYCSAQISTMMLIFSPLCASWCGIISHFVIIAKSAHKRKCWCHYYDSWRNFSFCIFRLFERIPRLTLKKQYLSIINSSTWRHFFQCFGLPNSYWVPHVVSDIERPD